MRAAAVRAVLAALALVTLACGTTGAAQGPGTGGTIAPVAPDFSVPGPYPVGHVAVAVAGVTMSALVAYPADPGRLAGTERVPSYRVSELFGPPLTPLVQALPWLEATIPTDAHVDAPVHPDGPFPLVLVSPEDGGDPRLLSAHLRHLASWGYVVAAVSDPTTTLAAMAAGVVPAPAATGGDTLEALFAALREENLHGGSRLERGIDMTRVAVEGHGEGGRRAYQFALRQDRVRVWIGIDPLAPTATDAVGDPAAGLPIEAQVEVARQGLLSTPALGRRALVVHADVNTVIPFPRARLLYDWLAAPKQLVAVAGAGQSSMLDTCAPMRDRGGLQPHAEEVPPWAPLLRRWDDGCTPAHTDPARVQTFVAHLVVATMRRAFGQDPDALPLDATVLEARFGALFGETLSASSG